ncbi:MAG TPA: AraC family transcriptional regulator [Chthoniobacteraceae bacterium]|nr:AraC family transcriptional regulator [Chthoniobacteraceae bacterium]
MDFIRNKEDWVRRRFATCSFSLILRGRGSYTRGGRTWEVIPPCVLIELPGDYLEYGPGPPSGRWDELYITYAGGLTRKFEECHFVNREQPVWPIANPSTANVLIAELEALSKAPAPETVVDRVDRACERLILETRLSSRPARGGEQMISVTLSEMRMDLARPFDWEKTAARNGVSVSTFRRRWQAASTTPPARYLKQLRITESCRLLAETALPIYEIAHMVGFADELYFSRRFHRELGMAPREYRHLQKARTARSA